MVMPPSLEIAGIDARFAGKVSGACWCIDQRTFACHSLQVPIRSDGRQGRVRMLGRLRLAPKRSGLHVMLVVALLLVLVLGPATTASAFTVNTELCDSATDAGYTDVAVDSPHKADIDCLLYWRVTNQTGTYDPRGVVSRWQMALFMTRAYGAFGDSLPSGPDQGFSDIGSLAPEWQTAINQLKQLSITAGTSPTTFEPDGSVTRWQMALFLTRLVSAARVALPPVEPTGFTDIGDLSQAAQEAIAQLKSLGVTQGTSPTTFGPYDVVTREQMASFIVRTLRVTWWFNTLSAATDCVGSMPVVCTDPANSRWVGSFEDGVLVLRHGWGIELPIESEEDAQSFETLDMQYLIDGVEVPATEVRTELDGVLLRSWVLEVGSGDTPGTFQLEVRWIDPAAGGHVMSTILTMGWS